MSLFRKPSWLSLELPILAMLRRGIAVTTWLMVALPTTELLVNAAEPRAPRVAVIAGEGERAVSSEVLAVVEARLSQAGVALVEREQLRRILQEHVLNLQRADERLKLGNLTAADLFLTINAVPIATNKLWRVQMIEVRTGVALNGTTIEESFVATNAAPLADLAHQASTRLAVPHEARRYVGIAGFRSEELNRSLDGLAESLGGLVPLELSGSPRVVVLDRENLAAIASEDWLTEAGVDLRPATTWIEGFLRRLPDEGKLRATLLFHPLPDGEPSRVTVTSAGNLSELSREVTRAILDELKVAPGLAANTDAKAEAKRFAERAAILWSHRAYEPAARAMDAALVLAPSQEYRLNAAKYWNEASVYLYSAYELAREGKRYTEDAPLDVKLQLLPLRLRASRLYLEMLREHVAANEKNPRQLAQVPRILNGNSLRSLEHLMSTDGLTSEALERRHELRRIHLEIYRITKKCYEADWDEPEGRDATNLQLHPQVRWCGHVGNSLLHLTDWTDDLDEWMELTREVIHDLKTRKFDAVNRGPNLVWERVAGGSLSRVPDNRPRLIEFYESLAHDDNEVVRVVALYRLQSITMRAMTDRDPAACRRFLDEFIRFMPVEHPLRVVSRDISFPSLQVFDVFANTLTGKGDGVNADKYAHAIFDPIFAGRHADRLRAWALLAREWLDSLKGRTNASHVLALVEQFMDLQNALPATERANESFGRYLHTMHEKLAGSDAASEAAWQEYEFEPVPLHGLKPGYQVRGASEFNGQLLLALGAPATRPNMIVELARVPLTGGRVTSLGQAVIKADFWALNDQKDLPRLGLVPDTNAVYVLDHNIVSRGRGVAVFRRNGVFTAHDTNTFPAGNVLQIAALHGRGYFGLSGALVEYHPEDDSFRELLSSRSGAEPRHLLDGGSQFGLSGPLADELRNCIWFGVMERRGAAFSERSGLWRYSLKSGQVERISGSGYGLLKWQQGRLLASSDSTYGMLEPDSLGFMPLFGKPDSVHGPPLFSAPGGIPHRNSVVWLQDHLITGQHALELWTTNSASSFRRRIGTLPDWDRDRSVLSLDLLPDGRVLLVSEQGELWLIRRKKMEGNQISRP